MKTKILIPALMATVLTASSCSGNRTLLLQINKQLTELNRQLRQNPTAATRSNPTVPDVTSQPEDFELYVPQTSKSSLKESRELQLAPFSAIRNQACITVHYTQGSKQKVIAMGYQHVFDLLHIEVKDNGVLDISIRKDSNKSLGNSDHIDLYITTPQLKQIDNDAVLKLIFEGAPQANDFTVNNRGVTTLFSSQEMTFNHFTLKNDGVTNFRMTPFKVSEARIYNNGVVEFSKSFGMMGFQKAYFDLAGSIDASSISLEGKEVEFSCPGANRLGVQVDCEKLRVNASGSSKLTFSGTADDVDLSNSGVAKIDVSRLNE